MWMGGWDCSFPLDLSFLSFGENVRRETSGLWSSAAVFRDEELGILVEWIESLRREEARRVS